MHSIILGRQIANDIGANLGRPQLVRAKCGYMAEEHCYIVEERGFMEEESSYMVKQRGYMTQLFFKWKPT